MAKAQGVTLLPEACTGAVCAFCKEHKDDLAKCARCKRAWYCSKEHQKEHYPQHKDMCRTVAPLIEGLIQTMDEVQPKSYADATRLILGAAMFAQRNLQHAGPQVVNIFSMINNTAFCRVCFKLREQLPAGTRLVCCPKCLWGWCCSEHFEQFQPQHESFCAEYASMMRLHKLQRELADRDLTAGNQLPYPMNKVSQLQLKQVLDSWQKYRHIRVPSISNEDTWRAMTEDMAIPLTAAWACRLLYSSKDLAGLQDFHLHLVGAAHFEFTHVLANTAIEELLHLLPSVKALHATFIGPEWKVISPGPTCSHFDREVCPPCSRLGCTRSLTIYRGAYEDYAASKEWTTPSLAMALNSGVGCEEQASWSRAVKVLLDRQVPCCFTSMNAMELGLDVAALQKAGAHILAQQRNKFSSLVPLRDLEAQPDEFYYTNGYVICFKGREAAAGASSDGGSSS